MKFDAFFTFYINKLDCLYSNPIPFTKIYINSMPLLINFTNFTEK